VRNVQRTAHSAQYRMQRAVCGAPTCTTSLSGAEAGSSANTSTSTVAVNWSSVGAALRHGTHTNARVPAHALRCAARNVDRQAVGGTREMGSG
jgi:hypothetical protein